jgi:hypothetical protein
VTGQRLLEYRETPRGHEPECEVLVRVPDAEPTWFPGFVRAWFRYADGWSASVQYSIGPGSNYLATFPPEHFRKAELPT